MGVIISDGLDWVSTWKTEFQSLVSEARYWEMNLKRYVILHKAFVKLLAIFFLNLAFFDLPKIYFSTDLMFEFQH